MKYTKLEKNMGKNNKFSKTVVIMMLLLSTLSAFIPSVSGAVDTSMGISTLDSRIEIGDNFIATVWVDPGSEIVTTWKIYTFTFNETLLGMVNATSVTFTGFWGSVPFHDPGAIHNDTGEINDIQCFDFGGGTSDNHTGCIIEFTARQCGLLYLNLSNTRMDDAGGSVTHNTQNATITIHPHEPAFFSAIAYNSTQINLTFSPGIGGNTSVVRGSKADYPSTPDSGEEIYNGTVGHCAHNGLNQGETWYYSVWTYNSTHNLLSQTYLECTATTGNGNSLPAFGTPHPSNTSSGQDLSLTWSIFISDVDSDPFDWYIECNNGHGNSSTIDTNGIKELSISGLDYDTEHIVWVNASDGYDWTREWFTFSTRSLYTLSKPTSFDAGTYSASQINLTWIIGSYADFTYIEWNSFATWNRNEGNEIYNGTEISFDHTNLDPRTQYFYQVWSYNVTDNVWSPSYASDDATTFNTPPSYGIPNPSNTSSGQNLSLTWSVFISDNDGDTFDWSIECSNGDTASASGASDGFKSLPIGGLSCNTEYTVWVNASDDYDWTREWFTFTTRDENEPVVPGSFVATANGRFQIDIAWSKGFMADFTLVEWNTTAGPWDRGEGVVLYNESAESTSHFDLEPDSTCYYQAWSWNNTDHVWSSSFGSDEATTDPNILPSYGTPTPENCSDGQELSLTWSIFISDVDHDMLNWSINCMNGQVNSSTGDTDGIKELLISGLEYDTEYIVWVNTTDGYDWTNKTYFFTTRAALVNSSPVFSDIVPADVATGVLVSTSQLGVMIEDLEGDPIDWTIETSPDIGNNSETSGTNGTKTCDIANLDYSTVYTWFVNASDGSGWTNESYSFSTEADDSGGTDEDTSGNTGGDTGGQNQNPMADASAGEPYMGFIGEEITFDGSNSSDDVNITDYFWDFGDGTNGTGNITTHVYSSPGTYTVALTVTDNDGATDTDETTVEILTPNQPPITPKIERLFESGTVNREYDFFFKSTDPDNDTITFFIDWGDGSDMQEGNGSNELKNHTTHSWIKAGKYTITAYAKDPSNATSDTAEEIILIDAINVGNIGYLTDDNSDGVYDTFHNDTTGVETAVELQDGGTYLIDNNEDNEWDYIFNPETGELTRYEEDITKTIEGSPLMLILLIGTAIAIIAVIVYLYKKDYF